MFIKKIILAIIIATGFLFSCSNDQNIPNDNYTVIKGKFNTPYKQEVELMKVINGKEVLVSKVFLDDSKEFGFSFRTNEEGFYTIGNPYIEIPIYVKGNEVFNVDYDFFKSSKKYTQTKIPNEENKTLYDWIIKNDTLNYYSNFSTAKPTTYVEFFPFYKNYMSTMKSFHNDINTNNKKFNNLMNKFVDLSVEYSAMQMIFTPRPIHPGKEKMASFYTNICENSIVNDADILKLPNGLSTLGMHQMFKSMYIDEDTDRINAVNNMAHSIKNDTVKAYYALDKITQYKVYNKEYEDFIGPMRNAINKIPNVKAKVKAYEETIRTFEPGTQGYEFTFKDVNDKDVSFSDLKGKVVYIDFWAMWCSPCKREIPYLKKLEKELHGKDIVFVSVSMDKPKLNNKWKQFVKDQKLTGVQLIATDAFNTKLAKDYKINSIPRFILFDKEGKVIDGDAKRPSDPKLKKQLINILKN